MAGVPESQSFQDQTQVQKVNSDISLQGFQQQLQVVATDVQFLRDAFRELPREIVGALGRGEALRVPPLDAGQISASEAFQVEKGCLRAELNNVARQNIVLTERVKSLEKELLDAHYELDKVRKKETALRTIVLDKTGAQRVSDQEVKDMFVSIRQKALAIANCSVYDFERVPERTPQRAKDREMAMFYDTKTWKGLTVKDRKNRVMAKIFDILHLNILNFKAFSAVMPQYIDTDPTNKNGTKTGIESGLRRFETILEINDVSDSLIANWRIATIDCMNQMSTQLPRGKRSGQVIFDLFAPIIAEDLATQRVDDLRDQITAMCEEAFNLRMIMRQSKEGYQCEFPPLVQRPCFIDEYDYLVEPMSVEGGKNKEGTEEIAYTLFGALTKSMASQDGSGRMTFEKAHVIMKRR